MLNNLTPAPTPKIFGGGITKSLHRREARRWRNARDRASCQISERRSEA